MPFAAIEIRNPTVISQTRYRILLLALSLAPLFAICFFRGESTSTIIGASRQDSLSWPLQALWVVFQIAKTRDDKAPFPVISPESRAVFFWEIQLRHLCDSSLVVATCFPSSSCCKPSPDMSGGPLVAAVVSTSLIFMISVVSAVLSWHLLESQVSKAETLLRSTSETPESVGRAGNRSHPIFSRPNSKLTGKAHKPQQVSQRLVIQQFASRDLDGWYGAGYWKDFEGRRLLSEELGFPFVRTWFDSEDLPAAAEMGFAGNHRCRHRVLSPSGDYSLNFDAAGRFATPCSGSQC